MVQSLESLDNPKIGFVTVSWTNAALLLLVSAVLLWDCITGG